MTEPPIEPIAGTSFAPLARRTAHGMAWGQVAKTLEVALTLVIGVIAVRALGPTGFGFYALLTTLAGIGSVLIPLVTADALGAILPRIADRRGRLYLFALVTGIRSGVILAIIATIVPAAGLLRGLFGIDPVSGQVLILVGAYWLALDLLNGLAGFYHAELDVRPVAIWRSGGQLATIVALGAVVLLGEASVGLVLLAVTVGYALGGAGLAAGLRGIGRPRRPEGNIVRFAIGLTRHVWVIGVLTLALTPQMAVLLIGALTSDAVQVGLFAAAVGIVGRAQVLLVAGWAAMMIPTFGTARAQGGEADLARPWRLFTQLWLLVAVPLNLLLLVTADAVVVTLFGSAYAAAGELLFWTAAFNVGLAFLASPSCISALWALDRQWMVARVRLVAAPATLALAVLLITRHGALGAVVALGVGVAGTSAVELLLAHRAGVVAYPVRFALQIALGSGLAAMPGALLRPDSAADLALAVGLGAAVFAAAIVLLRPFSPQDLETLERVSPRLARSPLRLLTRR
ncbi:MAG TPA: hypothetical protein VM184_03205 [Gaiellaceae bacterium]|nr:hypothetical protein [Gaiellaceae bacterium]